MIEIKCEFCRFYFPENTYKGECRYGPPQICSSSFGTFPETNRNNFCGKFKRKFIHNENWKEEREEKSLTGGKRLLLLE